MEDSTPSSKRASPERAPKRTVLCAMQIPIAPEYRGQGLSTRMIRRMTEIRRDHGLDTLIAPVRPTLKHLYPLAPLERYISWRARTVLIRVGSRRDEPYFSAGDAPVFGNDGEPLSVWPPHRE